MSETEEKTALAVVETLVPAKLYAPGKVVEMLDKIEDEVRKRASELDISTPTKRKAIISLAAKVASSKVAMDDAGKALTDEWRQRTNAVNEERRIIRERMDKLRDETRKPVTDWENAEKDRIQAHQDALAAIQERADYSHEESSQALSDRLAYLRAYPARDWQEFAVPAAKALEAEIAWTERLLADAQKREAEQAELARLRAAEENATRAAKEAEERAEQRRKQAAEQAERDRLAAIEAERKRVADEKDALEAAEQKRAADQAHKARIHNEALTDLVAAGLSDAMARAAVVAIAAGKVRNFGVKY
jgi:hypothetical protein